MDDLQNLLKSFREDLNGSIEDILTKSQSSISETSQIGDDIDCTSDECTNASIFDEYSDTVDYDGLIFTDTSKLADKYSVSISEILQSIHNYVKRAQNVGIDLFLLDVAQDKQGIVEQYSWTSYLSYLENALDKLGINDPDKTVFIIGGEDVVPMPRMLNPLQSIGSEYLDVDMRYCYPCTEQPEEPSIFLSAEPRCSVGRYPLETGFVDSDFEQDLNRYLEEASSYWTEDGIPIREIRMTTTESWIPSSKEMMREIPSSRIQSDLLTIKDNMLISPDIDMDDPDYFEEYLDKISDTDFLIFNLHGSDAVDSSSYFGEDRDHLYYPEAFQLVECSSLSPKIITATACFGARFIGYSREQSMLLTAIDSGTVLFVGSCTTALGRGNGDVVTDLLIPAGMSELMLKLYNTYLCLGHPAGRALIDAKLDYYKNCADIDGHQAALATIMMFNLFGDPRLFMIPKLDHDFEEKVMKRSVLRNKVKLQYRPTQYKTIYSKELSTSADLLSTVRSLVDNNLSQIHADIQESLYDTLGLEKKYLQQITESTFNGERTGFNYLYRMRKGPLDQYVLVTTDLDGRLCDIISTK